MGGKWATGLGPEPGNIEGPAPEKGRAAWNRRRLGDWNSIPEGEYFIAYLFERLGAEAFRPRISSFHRISRDDFNDA